MKSKTKVIKLEDISCRLSQIVSLCDTFCTVQTSSQEALVYSMGDCANIAQATLQEVIVAENKEGRS